MEFQGLETVFVECLAKAVRRGCEVLAAGGGACLPELNLEDRVFEGSGLPGLTDLHPWSVD